MHYWYGTSLYRLPSAPVTDSSIDRGTSTHVHLITLHRYADAASSREDMRRLVRSRMCLLIILFTPSGARLCCVLHMSLCMYAFGAKDRSQQARWQMRWALFPHSKGTKSSESSTARCAKSTSRNRGSTTHIQFIIFKFGELGAALFQYLSQCHCLRLVEACLNWMTHGPVSISFSKHFFE